MGTVLKGRCPGCGYLAELNTGGGMWDCRPDVILQAGNGDQRLQNALAQGGQASIRRVAALCERCKKLYAGAQVTWHTPDGDTGTVSGSCPDCGGTLKWYPPDAQSVRCPVCGQSMTLEAVGFWD